MTRSVLSLRSTVWLLGAVVALALVVGVVAMPTDAHACTQGCEVKKIHEIWEVCLGNKGDQSCLACTFCY